MVSCLIYLVLQMLIDSNINPNLAHLSHDLLKTLINDYYDNMPIVMIKKKFILTNITEELSTLFPFALNQKKSCTVCGYYLKHRFEDRCYIFGTIKPPFCIECEIKEILADKKNRAPELNKIESKSHRALVSQCFTEEGEVILGKRVQRIVLSFMDFVYLRALIEWSNDVENKVLLGFNPSTKLAPLDNTKPFLQLLKKGIISLHKSTPNSALTTRNGKVISIDPIEAHWQINITKKEISLLSEDKNYVDNFPDNLERLQAQLLVSVDECLEYVIAISSTNEYSVINIEKENGFRSYLISKLQSCSLSYMYYMIWNGCRVSANKFNQLKTIPLQKIINKTTLLEIQSQDEYVELVRPYLFPESKVSDIMYDEILTRHDSAQDHYYKQPY